MTLATPRPHCCRGLLLAAILACGVGNAWAVDHGAQRKVIIDQDAMGPAGSNLQAILLLLQSPDVDLLGITVPSGDGWRDEEVAHALRMLEIAQRPHVPVIPGAVFPLINSPELTRRWESLYGKLVYKGCWTEQFLPGETVTRTPYHADPYLIPASPAGAPALKPAAGTAAEFLIRKVHEFPGEVTIIAAGPLTDLALAARLDPQFASLAKELVFMGGSFNPTAADNAFAAEYVNSPRREFNMRFDPEAASIVLHQHWKRITQIPIDPTTRTFFKPEFFRDIGRGQAPFDAYLARFGQSYPMWDELAVAVWLDPSLVTQSANLLEDVSTSFGPNYGDTLSWPLDHGPALGEQAVHVVLAVDVPRFERQTIALLSAPSPSP